jgi:hypothetical protein
MNKLVQLLLLMILPLVVMASPLKEGTLSVLLFSEGKPLANNEIKIDGKKVFLTDEDGAVKIPLVAGRHQIEIFGKNAAGENLGYFKKPVGIKEGRDTEIIATLSKTGADSIDIDVPVAVAASVEREAQKATGEGTLTGQVLSSEGNTPIAGARVFVRGTGVDIRTDANGRFSAKVPSGKTLSISVVHSAYSAQTIGGIVVKKDGSTSRTVKLTPASMELEEFVVLAPKIEGSISDVIAEEKNINAVANILGSEEMSKKGDSDAASALKRVTGVTLVGGRSIYVRGLGDRYANVELNSLPLPSPDPTKRVVQLDLFPTNAIGSMVVQKSASGEIPSNFGGGYINIRTKNSENKDYYKITLEAKADSTVGSNALDYQGGDLDFLGLDDGYRALPLYIEDHSDVIVGERIKNFTTTYFTPEELWFIDKAFINRDVALTRSSLPFGGGLSVEGAKSFEIDQDSELSVYANYKYNQEHHTRTESFTKYDMSLVDGSMIEQPASTGTNELAQSEYSHSVMINVAYSYLDVFNLKYVHLLSHVAEKVARITDGQFGSNATRNLYHYLDWEERTLTTDQIIGDIDYAIFDKKSNFEFGLEYAKAHLYQPNNFFYMYSVAQDGTNYLTTGTTNLLSKRLDSTDDVYAFYLKNKTDLNIFSDDDYLTLGLNYSLKERSSEYQKFYLDQQTTTYYEVTNIDSLLDQYVRTWPDPYNRIFALDTLFDPADYFDADVHDFSAYTNLFVKPREDMEVLLGVRFVDFIQNVDQYAEDSDNPDYTLRRNIAIFTESLDISGLYPSMSVKYLYNEKNHFDLALSKTFIVPDLREFTSGIYFHPYDVATVLGNPDLKNTDIYNADLKYSHYMSEDEYIKAGLFFKYLVDPIEDIQIPSSSLPIYSFANTDSATLYGIELDWRKSLEFLGEKFTQFYIAGNLSYTDSDVTLKEEQEDLFSTNHRQLQGLSQYVANATLGYDSSQRSLALSYNYMSERIRKVGLIDDVALNGEYVRWPDTIEVPPHLLDFVWRENLPNDYEISFKAGNILNSEVIWKYDNDKVINSYKPGSTFSVSASKKF